MNEKSNPRRDTPRDQVFADPKDAIGDFTFNSEVATVFDDMVARSVPFYVEMQRMIGELAVEFVPAGTNVYDLGCSTGTTMLLLHDKLPPSVRFIGVDNSAEMIAKCRDNLTQHQMQRPHELRCCDLDRGVQLENASLVTMILTLQFIRPLNREQLLRNIFDGLNDNGCLILVEKVLGEDSLFNRQFIKLYYDFKRRSGYSDLEISQKREALENVLIPYKLLENRELLLKTGFRYVDVFFKWYNFCALIAVK
jgi:tRNA (cmo5U34)-methyltransferase